MDDSSVINMTEKHVVIMYVLEHMLTGRTQQRGSGITILSVMSSLLLWSSNPTQ